MRFRAERRIGELITSCHDDYCAVGDASRSVFCFRACDQSAACVRTGLEHDHVRVAHCDERADGKRVIMSRMPVAVDQHQMWRLTADRKTVRMRVPAIKLAGQSNPLDIFVDLDAKTVDDVLRRLSELRTQMLPAPTRN